MDYFDPSSGKGYVREIVIACVVQEHTYVLLTHFWYNHQGHVLIHPFERGLSRGE